MSVDDFKSPVATSIYCLCHAVLYHDSISCLASVEDPPYWPGVYNAFDPGECNVAHPPPPPGPPLAVSQSTFNFENYGVEP